jgi:hypothetical protein
MRRYYPPDDDDRRDSYFNPDEEDGEEDGEVPEGLVEEIAAAIDKEDIINAMQFDLAHVELNQDLLNRAIEIASKNIWWKLKSNESKLKEIETIYKRLQKLTTEGNEEEEENADL